MLAVVNA